MDSEALDIIDDDLPYGFDVVDVVDGVPIIGCTPDVDHGYDDDYDEYH
jgi:hypothetical protein